MAKGKTTKLTPKKKKAVDEELIAELLPKKMGNISAVARAMKLSRKSIYLKIEESETLQTVLEDSRERMLDDAEDNLGKAIRKGEAWAVCFALKTQGQKRGYIEKQQIEHSGNMPLEIIVKKPKVE